MCYIYFSMVLFHVLLIVSHRPLKAGFCLLVSWSLMSYCKEVWFVVDGICSSQVFTVAFQKFKYSAEDLVSISLVTALVTEVLADLIVLWKRLVSLYGTTVVVGSVQLWYSFITNSVMVKNAYRSVEVDPVYLGHVMVKNGNTKINRLYML